MSNYTIKAKNKKTGTVFVVEHNINALSKFKYFIRPETGYFTETEFNDRFEVVEDPYGGMEVLDNVPVETWRDRFDKTIIVSEQMNKDIKEFFQQELDRISNNVGFLRHWLNEDRITDKKMVTNEEIEVFLNINNK